MNAGTPPPLEPTTNTSGYNYVLQFIAAVREEREAKITDAKKAVKEHVPRLRASIHAKRQELAKIKTEIEEEEAQVRKVFLDLETLKAQDPLEEIHNRSSAREHTPAFASIQNSASGISTSANTAAGRPEHEVAPQTPNQSVLDKNVNIIRANKRRRTADDNLNSNKLTDKTVEFDTVYANGQPTHLIVEHPRKSRTFYILECQKHSRQFNGKPLLSAMQHAHGKDHGTPMGAEFAIKELGSQVLGCDADKFRQNNDAFNPRVGPNAQPRLSEVLNPEPGKLYLGPWGTRASRTWYAVVVLPLDSLQSIGMEGKLRDTGLLKGNIPRCYKVDQGRIVGFKTGYEDDGVAHPSRKYPLLWIQANVHFNFRDGKLQIPKQQCFSWLPASKLRPFYELGPDGKPIEIPEAIKDLFQPPGPDQAPLADMGGDAEVIVVDDESESDKDHVDDVPGQRSEEEENGDYEGHESINNEEENGDEAEHDAADDLNDKTRGVEPEESGGATAGAGSVGTPSIPKDASTRLTQSPGTMGMQPAKNQPLHAQPQLSQPPQIQPQQAQPTPAQPPPGQLRQSTSIVQSPESMYPSPISRTGSLPQHPQAPTVPSSSGSLPPRTIMSSPSNPITTDSQTGPATLRTMAAEAMAHKSLTNHHLSFQPQLGKGYMLIQEDDQSAQETAALHNLITSRLIVSQGQAEMAPMGPVQHSQHNGPTYPGPNQMLQRRSADSRSSEKARVPPWLMLGESKKRSADGKPAS